MYTNSATALTRDECKLIDSFERSSEESFVDFFSGMAHRLEFCMELSEECFTQITKLPDEMSLLILGTENIKNNPNLENIFHFLDYTLSNVIDASGVTFEVQTDNFKIDRETYRITFIDKVKSKENWDDVINYSIARKNTIADNQHREFLIEIFQEFVETDLPCLVFAVETINYEIILPHILIDSSLSPRGFEICISEEIHNSFGFNEPWEYPSMFDMPYLREPNSTRLSDLDILLVKIKYMDFLEPGFSFKETRHALSKYISSACQY